MRRVIPAFVLLLALPLGAVAGNRVGDADNSGSLNATDAALVQARVLGIVDEWSISPMALADADGEFAPVSPEMFNFEVSGLKVVQSWLKYRMKKGAGKKSSPLDDIRPERWTAEFTTELLELLWVLEATLEGYSEQQAILEAVIEGLCIGADELPSVPEHRRKPPAEPKSNGNGELFDSLD